MQFKESLLISFREDISQKEKIFLIKNIYKNSIKETYISDAWKSLSVERITSINDIESIVSKFWLIGFIEAEGSFYYVKKDKNRIVHAFEITQKLDPIVLQAIKYILHIPSSVQYKSNNYFSIGSTNSKSIENIQSYFKLNNDKSYFLGVKSFEFKVWTRTYKKFKGNFLRLNKIRDWINKLKNKHKY